MRFSIMSERHFYKPIRFVAWSIEGEEAYGSIAAKQLPALITHRLWAPKFWWYMRHGLRASAFLRTLGRQSSRKGAMEKKPRAGDSDGGGSGGGEASGSVGGGLVDRLPEALLVEVVGRVGLEGACSAAASCRALRGAAGAAFSAFTALDLSGFPPTNAILNRILAGNGTLRSLTINCSLLDDSAVAAIAKGSLRELSLLKCSSFSSYLFVVIGERCTNLRSITLEMANLNGSGHFVICRKSIAHIFKGCNYLEDLSLKFPLLAPGSVDFDSLVPVIPSTIKVLLLQPVANWQAKRLFPISTSLKTPFSGLESLSLVLDIITDELVTFITRSLANLIELCLEDNPASETDVHNDLTNTGLQALGLCQNLTHLSLTRGKQNYSSTFRRVNDFGILMLAEGCKQLKTVRLGGFSKVRDAGYAALLHSCKDLKKFEVSTGSCLSDLTCIDLDEAATKITEVRLLCCGLLTSETAISLSSCINLEVLDLSGCRSIADSGLVSVSQLSKLTLLDLAGSDITDAGLSALGNGSCPISSLCLRGCRRISNNGIASLLCGSGTINKTLVGFDIGNVPRISGRAVTVIAKNCKQISSLCLRNCHLITDPCLETLGSVQHNSGKSPIRMLDLSYCPKLSRNFLRLFEPPLFRGLRWLGVGKNVLERRGSSLTVAEILKQKPGLTICGNACEMGCRNQCHPDLRIQ